MIHKCIDLVVPARLSEEVTAGSHAELPHILEAESYEVAYCPAGHSNWGAENARTRPRVQARLDEEREMRADGRCAYMHELAITEPFYTLAEVALVRAGGWPCPFPRPKGIGGLYQLRSS